MNIPKTTLMLSTLGLSLTIGLAACQHVPVTFNGIKMNSAPLLADIKLEDRHLSECIREHIFDRQISRINQLTELNCAHRSIKSLKGLERFAQLVSLRLDKNPIESFKPLLALGNLERIEISKQPVDCGTLIQLRQRGVKVAGGCQAQLDQ